MIMEANNNRLQPMREAAEQMFVSEHLWCRLEDHDSLGSMDP